MRFARIVFLIAGIYGVVVLTPLYFMENTIGNRTPPAITHPEYFYGFIGVGLGWQVLFLILSSDPVRYRPMMIPSILEKVSYGAALLALYSLHRIPTAVLGIGSMDWVFAVLFAAAYLKTSRSQAGGVVGGRG